ncbi:MAG: hypothetical protein A3G41_02105 [Elusimicrobia bacterium RIFCSPLOWO2_12_FULL_59_9]|nr:MAG: hypothetical protein A3G41_02105 [Elusimicrobia bacterium RIFCSPLOWO2_12_FULL_59_9]
MLIFFNAMAFALTALGGGLSASSHAMSRESLWRLLSLGSGILLAITFVDVLPEALLLDKRMSGWGLITAFVLFFGLEAVAMMHSCQEYLEDCSAHILGWTALTALALHAFIDGANLSVSFRAGRWTGEAVGIGMGLHKFAEGLTVTSLFIRYGYSALSSLLLCALLAAATPLGSLAAWRFVSASEAGWVAGLLGFAAGCFLYIAVADILPRIHKTDDKWCPILFTGALVFTAVILNVPF